MESPAPRPAPVSTGPAYGGLGTLQGTEGPGLAARRWPGREAGAHTGPDGTIVASPSPGFSNTHPELCLSSSTTLRSHVSSLGKGRAASLGLVTLGLTPGHAGPAFTLYSRVTHVTPTLSGLLGGGQATPRWSGGPTVRTASAWAVQASGGRTVPTLPPPACDRCGLVHVTEDDASPTPPQCGVPPPAWLPRQHRAPLGLPTARPQHPSRRAHGLPVSHSGGSA